MRILGIALLALFAAAPAAVAGGGCDGRTVVHHIFESADRDQDGSLSRGEYQDAGLESYGVSFEESDGNGDGSTSLHEYLELYRRHHPTVGGTEV